MANLQDFNGLIAAAREEQLSAIEEAQRRQQIVEAARVQATEARLRTIALAQYAAQLFLEHGLQPSVRFR